MNENEARALVGVGPRFARTNQVSCPHRLKNCRPWSYNKKEGKKGRREERGSILDRLTRLAQISL